MRPRISIRGSVRPSVRRSVTPVQKPRFPDVFGRGEILYWIKWSTNVFWEPPLLLCRFICLFVHLSLHLSHMFSAKFNTHGDTVQTHHCPVHCSNIHIFLGNRINYGSKTLFFTKYWVRVIHSTTLDIVLRWDIHFGCKVLAPEHRMTSECS